MYRQGKEPVEARDATAARRLVSVLGPTLVAALVGASGRDEVLTWIGSPAIEPPVACGERLDFALSIWIRLAQGESEDLARAWFIGGNPLLGEGTPITAIREGRWSEVSAAVEEMVTGTAGS